MKREPTAEEREKIGARLGLQSGEGRVEQGSAHAIGGVTTLTFALLRYSVAICKNKATRLRNRFFLGREPWGVSLR
jgi:hypothetical protein